MDSPIPSPRAVRRLRVSPVAGFLLATAVTLFHPTSLEAAEEDVTRAIMKPEGGTEPAIFYKADASTNSGIGEMRWAAVAGSKLSRKVADPWGNAEGAFALPEGAQSGAAISGATQTDLLAGPGGAVIFFFKAPDGTVENAMLLSRGPWEKDKPVFDLRATGGAASRVKLYSGAGGGSPMQADLGRAEPSGWNFVGFTWNQTADGYQLKSFVSPLAEGAALEEKEILIPAVGASGIPISLAGRFSQSTGGAVDRLLLLDQGAFTHFAIYQDTLPDAAIRAVFDAALKGLAH